jgi:hypothetical protein
MGFVVDHFVQRVIAGAPTAEISEIAETHDGYPLQKDAFTFEINDWPDYILLDGMSNNLVRREKRE